MPQEVIFKYCLCGSVELIIDIPVTPGGINIEIPDPECGKVLKEVCPLAGIDPVILQSGLNNDPGA